MTSLITGASGFIGRHLLPFLRQSAPQGKLFSLGRRPCPSPGVTHILQDLNDANGLAQALGEIRPDRIYHLAGESRVTSEIGLPDYFARNFLTTQALLDAVGKLGTSVSFFFASSVHIYGNQPGLVTETSPPRPANPYGFSKYLSEEALRRFAASHPRVKIVVARLYSCIGPGQSEGFVVADLCRRLAQLPKGRLGVLKTGPLGGFRRFVDIRDAVRFFPALLACPEASRFEIFNIASPHELTIEALVRSLVRISGKTPKIESAESHATNPFVGLKLGWEKLQKAVPEIQFRPIDETLRDTYDWARIHLPPPRPS